MPRTLKQMSQRLARDPAFQRALRKLVAPIKKGQIESMSISVNGGREIVIDKTVAERIFDRTSPQKAGR